MEFIDPLANIDAYKYAFCSAIKEHLLIVKHQTELRDVLNEEGEDMNVDNVKLRSKNFETRDLLFSLEIVVDSLIDEIMDYHVMQDVVQRKNWGFPSKSLTHHFPLILLGPKPSHYDLQKKTTLEMIRTAGARRGPDKLSHEKYSIERNEELGKLFYSILRNTFEYQLKFSNPDLTNKSKVLTLSALVSAFLKNASSTYSSIIKERDYINGKLESVIVELKRYSDINFEDMPIEALFEGFKFQLKNHLELLLSANGPIDENLSIVLKLREQGNNLMSNSAYAQAIKVYTEATNYCVAESLNNLPQILINRAIAFIGLTCFPEAIDDLNEALTYDISSTPAWVQLGYAQLYMGHSLLALKCYCMAIQCCCGNILPTNFPNDEQLIEEYKISKIKSTLPQFIEQLLRGVQLTETRATQQRYSAAEINFIIGEIQNCLEILMAEVDSSELYCFLYPPHQSPSTFRTLASDVNLSRPSILNHEVNQGVIAGVDTSTNPRVGRPTPVTVETRTNPLRTETFAERNERLGRERAERLDRVDRERAARLFPGLGRIGRETANAAATAAFSSSPPGANSNNDSSSNSPPNRLPPSARTFIEEFRSRSRSNTENGSGSDTSNSERVSPSNSLRTNNTPDMTPSSSNGTRTNDQPRRTFGGFSQFFENEGRNSNRSDNLRSFITNESPNHFLDVISGLPGVTIAGSTNELNIDNGVIASSFNTTTPSTNDDSPQPRTQQNQASNDDDEIMSLQANDLD